MLELSMILALLLYLSYLLILENWTMSLHHINLLHYLLSPCTTVIPIFGL